MDLGLSGKKAIVTGGTRGIGRAIVELLASEGCHVGLCARNETAVRATVTELAGKGVQATGKAVDVGDGLALKAWVEAVGREFEGLDIVVANVSGFGVAPHEEDWQKSYTVASSPDTLIKSFDTIEHASSERSWTNGYVME